MSIPRDSQVVLNAWMALAGLAPSHAYLNGHSAIARVPDNLASWTATVNGFVNANYAGPDGTARLVDAVITNLGLSAVVGIREIAMEFFNSQPQNRGGLVLAAADWLLNVTPDAQDHALRNAQTSFRNAQDTAFAHSSNPASADAAPARPAHIPINLPANTTPPVTGNIFELTTPALINPGGSVQTRVFDMSTVPNVTEVRTMPGSVFNNMSAAQASNVVMLDPGPAPSRHAPSTFNIHGATNPGQLDTLTISYSPFAPMNTIIAPGVETVRIAPGSVGHMALGFPFGNGGLADTTRLEAVGTGQVVIIAGDHNSPVVLRGDLIVDGSGMRGQAAHSVPFVFDARWSASSGITIIGSATHSSNLVGTNGSDVIRGGAGDDFISAGAGDDVIDAGAGDDSVSGGISVVIEPGGNDRITLGAGRDALVFHQHGTSNADIVTDFVAGEDRIELFLLEDALALFGAFGSLAPTAFLSATNNVATSATHRIIYNTSNGELWLDQDGNGASAPSLLATLIGIPTLTASDFTAF